MIEKIKKISASTLICFILISFVFCNFVVVEAAYPTSVNRSVKLVDLQAVSLVNLFNETLFNEASGGNTSVDIAKLVEVIYSGNTLYSSFKSSEFFPNLIKVLNPGKSDAELADANQAITAYIGQVSAKNNPIIPNLVDNAIANTPAATTKEAATVEKVESSNWWAQANKFFDSKGESIGTNPLEPLIVIIKVGGNAVIIIATIFLGIKYMYGSVDGKVEVKEGLFTLVIAMLFFYAGTTVYDILVIDKKLIFIGDTAETTIFNIYSTIIYVAKFIAIGGIIYVGVKYLATGAEGKAELKGKGVPFFIGIVMTFGTLSFLSFIQTVLADILPK